MTRPGAVNRRKVFWVTFGAAYAGMLFFGFMHKRADAFPAFWWVFGYLALIALWACLGALAAVAIAMLVQNRRRLSGRAGRNLRLVGRWFTR